MKDPASVSVERVLWRTVKEKIYYEHNQGEHIAIVGPTESGKTLLSCEVLKVLAERKATDGLPSRITAFGIKPRDSTLSNLGWPTITKWPPGKDQFHVTVWPKFGDPETAARRQRAVFRPLMKRIFAEGGQTVYIGEVAYFEDPQPEGLGLRTVIKQWWTIGRAMDLTLVADTQRPRGVGRAMWTEPAWFFVFRIEDYDDLARVKQIGGNRAELVDVISQLDDHEFVLIHRRGRSREIIVSKVELEGAKA